MATPGKRSTASRKSATAADRATPASRRKAASSPASPTHDAIAVRAYEIFIGRGGGDGGDQDDWFSAERELSSMS
jgi:hypothetical protein